MDIGDVGTALAATASVDAMLFRHVAVPVQFGLASACGLAS